MSRPAPGCVALSLVLAIGCAPVVRPSSNPHSASTFADLAPDAVAKLDTAEAAARSLRAPDSPLAALLAAVPPAAWDHHADPPALRTDAAIFERVAASFPPRFSFVGYWTLPLSREIGFDGFGDRIGLSTRKLRSLDAMAYAGILWHEVAHKAGYVHDGDRRTGNECAVPYLLGDAARIAAPRAVSGAWGRLPDDACPGLVTALAAQPR